MLNFLPTHQQISCLSGKRNSGGRLFVGLLSAVIFFLFATVVHAQGISIPLRTQGKPASDLIHNGQVMDPGAAVTAAQTGVDLSRLNPTPNRFWEDKRFPTQGLNTQLLPPDNVDDLHFSDVVAQSASADLAEIKSTVFRKSNPSKRYRLTLSRYTHSSLMRAALLRKLGYLVPSAKFYRSLKLNFSDEAEMKEFLATAQAGSAMDLPTGQWILQQSSKPAFLVFSMAVVEEQNSELFDLMWGAGRDPKDNSNDAAIDNLNMNRAWRALIVPYVLVDLPESINRYSSKVGGIVSGQLLLNHPSARNFRGATIEDVRWILRRVAELSSKDWEEIAREGQFPTDSIREFITRINFHRAKNFLALGGVSEREPLPLPELIYNSPDGLIVGGKVVILQGQKRVDRLPGLPLRYSQGDRPSPVKEGDFGRFLRVEAMSSAISSGLDQLNKKFQVLTLEQAQKKYVERLTNRINEHIRTKPFEPLYKTVETWGGPVAGVELSGTRQLTTGTFFGSTAPIQMVDNVRIGANVGYFLNVDGVRNAFPGVGGNISLTRDYTHVRPVNSVEEGSKGRWSELLIPRMMDQLVTTVTNFDGCDRRVDEQGEKICEIKTEGGFRHPVDAFLSRLRRGEVFSITDQLVGSLSARVTSPLDALLGASPLSFLNSVSLGADGASIFLYQTSILRTDRGLEISLRGSPDMVRGQESFGGNRFSTGVTGVEFNMDYFLNVLKIRSQRLKQNVESAVYVIEYRPEDLDTLLGRLKVAGAEGENSPPPAEDEKPRQISKPTQEAIQQLIETRNKLRISLAPLFRLNNAEILQARFSDRRVQVNHEIETKSLNARFLMFNSSRFNEGSTLQIVLPTSPIASVTLQREKRGELEGRDPFGLGIDFLNGVFRQRDYKFNIERSRNPNPANTPFGQAFWRTVTVERDISPERSSRDSRAGEAPAEWAASLQRVWGGWKINRSELFRLAEKIEGEVAGLVPAGQRLLDIDRLRTLESLDFYRITQQLNVLESGVTKIRDLVVQPGVTADSPQERLRYLAGFFQRLSRISGSYRAADGALFNQVLSLLGSGDLEMGRKVYQAQCEKWYRDQGEGQSGVPVHYLYGTSYECLMPWVTELIKVSRRYPESGSKKAQAAWVADVLNVLDQNLPIRVLMQYLGETNYLFLVRFNGFRTGDENALGGRDGDPSFLSNTLGAPPQRLAGTSSLLDFWSRESRVSIVELDRSNTGTQ